MATEVVYKPRETYKPIYPGGTLTRPNFIPTYHEWLMAKGQQIMVSASVSGAGSSNFYTVPADNTFFITNITMGASLSAANKSGVYLMIMPDEKLIMNFIIDAGSVECLSTTKECFIKLNPGEYLQLLSVISVNSTVNIVGILVKNSDIPTL